MNVGVRIMRWITATEIDNWTTKEPRRAQELLPQLVWKLILGLLPLAFSAVMIKVCIERIREIKKGEEDDLSQY